MRLIARQFLTCLVILFIIGGLYAKEPDPYRKLYNPFFSQRLLKAFILHFYWRAEVLKVIFSGCRAIHKCFEITSFSDQGVNFMKIQRAKICLFLKVNAANSVYHLEVYVTIDAQRQYFILSFILNVGSKLTNADCVSYCSV